MGFLRQLCWVCGEGWIGKHVSLGINLVCWKKMLKIGPYIISFVKT